jgi:hypothetical protein
VLVFSAVASAADVYQWVDKHGEHFTNDRSAVPEGARVQVLHPEVSGPQVIEVTDEVELDPPFEIHPHADVSEGEELFRWRRTRDYVQLVLSRRFPAGWAVIEKAGGQCLEQRASDTDAPAQLAAMIPFLVQACGRKAGGSALVAMCPRRAWPSRSMLAKDAFVEQRPPCAPGDSPIGCDGFSGLLEGERGKAGLDELLADWAQAIYALTADHVVRSLRVSKPASCTRDQLLTHVWYVKRYLRLLRERGGADYAAVRDDCWRSVVTHLTLASEWALMESSADLWLALDEGRIQSVLTDPALDDEIRRVMFAPFTSSR